MGRRLHCASYEVPLWHDKDSLHLEALCQGERLVLISLVFGGISQAAYYPPPNRVVAREEVEQACRQAVAQFRGSGLKLIREERRNPLRRPVFVIDMDARGYDGILLSNAVAASA